MSATLRITELRVRRHKPLNGARRWRAYLLEDGRQAGWIETYTKEKTVQLAAIAALLLECPLVDECPQDGPPATLSAAGGCRPRKP